MIPPDDIPAAADDPPRLRIDAKPIRRHPIDMEPDPLKREYLRRAEHYVDGLATQPPGPPVAETVTPQEFDARENKGEMFLELTRGEREDAQMDVQVDPIRNQPDSGFKLRDAYSLRSLLQAVDRHQNQEMTELKDDFQGQNLDAPDVKTEYDARRRDIERRGRTLALYDGDGEYTLYNVAALREVQAKMEATAAKDAGGPPEMVIMPSGRAEIDNAVARQGVLSTFTLQGSSEERHNLAIISDRMLRSSAAGLLGILQHERGHLKFDMETGYLPAAENRLQESRADRFAQAEGANVQQGLGELYNRVMPQQAATLASIELRRLTEQDLTRPALSRLDMQLGETADHAATLERIADLQRQEHAAGVMQELRDRMARQMAAVQDTATSDPASPETGKGGRHQRGRPR